MNKYALGLKETIDSLPKYVKVTGSFARGEQTENSDIDFYIPTNKWDNFMKWAIKNLGLNCKSPSVGAVTWYEPTMMEFSHLFIKQKETKKEVEICGRIFKTW